MLPHGPLRLAGTGPKRPTQGVPTAAAMWSGPVSLEMKSLASLAVSASSDSDVGGAFVAAPSASATIRSAAADSSGPPQTTTDATPC